MIFDIILQDKKLFFLVLQRLKYFFGAQKLMTYSKFEFGAELERSQQNLDQKELESEP